MEFKTKYKVEDLLLKRKYKFRSDFRDMKIIIEPFSSDFRYKSSDCLCTVISTLDPKNKVRTIFECLNERKIPSGIDPDADLSGVDKNGNIVEINLLPFSSFPEPFRSFVNEILSAHASFSDRIIKTLFWRLNLVGSHDPLKERQSEYSFDGKEWDVIPIEPKYDVEVFKPITLSGDMHEEIAQIISDGNTQPVLHELFREAWGLRLDNYRSSLVIAIAAAEVGIKNCIITLKPDTEWILMNLTSPPIIKILREYIPTLLDKNTITTSDILVNKIHKGVTIRNKIIYTDSTKISYDGLIEILIAVKDLLWILDYYNGFDWALGYVDNKEHITNQIRK